MMRIIAALLCLSLCACARGEIGGTLRHAAGTKDGLAAISATAGATEAIFRFDLQLLQWAIGPKVAKP